MYEESSCFDPSSLQEAGILLAHERDDGFSQAHLPISNAENGNFSMEEQPDFVQNNHESSQAAAAMEIEIQHQLNLELEECCNDTNDGAVVGNTSNFIQDLVQNASWHELSDFNGENQYQHHHEPPPPHIIPDLQNGVHLQAHQGFSNLSYTNTPDLLNMFPLPRCSPSFLLPPESSAAAQKSSGFLASLGLLADLNPIIDGSSSTASVAYDPLLPITHPPQPPLFRDLFCSLPQGGAYAFGGVKNGSLFGGMAADERDLVNESAAGLYQDGEGRNFNNGVFEFGAGDIDCMSKNHGKNSKHYATERHRRVLFGDKYQALRQLIPSPTKIDRASIVGDAIAYINELKREVNELKILVEQKRCWRERQKRPKAEANDGIEGNEANCIGHKPCNGSSLRSSWLHRKSKNIEVDVRIIDDEVTVKLVQQKRINCLLIVSKLLDELQLDLHHVAGGVIGDYYSFLKICEGSIVYASAVANKVVDVVDRHYSAIQPSNSYN